MVLLASSASVQVEHDPNRPSGITTFVIWDAFSTFQPTAPTLVLPIWWTGNVCESYFSKYWKLMEEEQIGGPFLPRNPQGDDMGGKEKLVTQAATSESASDVQIRQDTAQAYRLQIFFEQENSTQCQSESDEAITVPDSQPQGLLVNMSMLAAAHAPSSDQPSPLSGWGHGSVPG